MVKKILFLSFTFLALQSQAQLLKPLLSGLSTFQNSTDEVIATSTDNDFMYVATRHSNGNNKGQTITINKWNGFYWQQFPSITFSDSSNSVKNIVAYKGQIYIGGNFIVKSPSFINTKTLVRFNTTLNKWEAVTSGSSGSLNFLGGNGIINTMAVYKNLLFIGGYFVTTINNDTTQHLVAFNGTTFSKCGLGSAANTGTNGMVYSLQVLNDSLFIGGTFTKAGGLTATNLAVITDSLMNWKGSVFNQSGSSVYKLTTYQNMLVVLANDAKIHIRNSANTYVTISSNLNYSQINDIEGFNNELWASGIFYFSGVPCTIAKFGTTWVSSNLPNINATNLFQYKSGLYLISTNDVAGNVKINRVAQIVLSQSRIGGRIYQDVNHNCKYDNNLDKPFANKLIYFSGHENFVLKTDSDGNYFTYVNSGTANYYVSLGGFKNWQIDSPCSHSKYTITPTPNSTFDSIDFVVKPSNNGSDITINLSPDNGFSSTRDYTQGYTVTYTNNGTQDINSMAGIELIFDKKLTNFSSNPPASVINGNKANWSFTNLKVGEQRTISFAMKAKADSFSLSDKLNFIASSSFLADLDKSDNADTLIQQITQASPSPVMKDVFPLPAANDSFSLVSAQSNEINYVIHFENTSLTDTIHNVIVIDTIDINSAIEFTQETGASHPYTTKIYNCPPALGKGVLVWTFNNINLPPYESVDDVMNRGHIGFKIKFNSSLPLGSIIKNRAHVVFDYYDPMKTNNTYAKLADFTGINNSGLVKNHPLICANPVSNEIVLLNDYKPETTYRLIDATGAIVLSGTINSKRINVSDLAKGMYLIIIEEKSLLTSQKIILY